MNTLRLYVIGHTSTSYNAENQNLISVSEPHSAWQAKTESNEPLETGDTPHSCTPVIAPSYQGIFYHSN